MTSGFIIVILLCSGGTCTAVQSEPSEFYSTIDDCKAALEAKAGELAQIAAQHRTDGRSAAAICLEQRSLPITEIEDSYDVLEPVVVHKEPSVQSAPIGNLEGGQRTPVTGLVTGTNWVRVLLKNGSTGFVNSDHLRKVAPHTAAASSPVSTAPSSSAPLSLSQPTQLVPPSESTTVQPHPSFDVPPASTSARAADRSEFRDCSSCPVMVLIPGGSFAMGSNSDPSERPVHRVTISPFVLGKFEVTVAEWAACVASSGCTYKPAQAEDDAERRPMMNLSWDDASQYVQWLSKVTGKRYRLPSEAEWEYAARAGTTTRFSWGEQVGIGKADCDGCGGPHDVRRPADISRFPPNPWGLFGMEGGVAEWVEDCWHASYQSAPADGTPWRSPDCQRHVLRGGSWKSPPSDITVSSRNFYDASVRYPANGARVVLERWDAQMRR